MDSYEVKVWPLPHVEVGGGGTMLLFHVRDGRHEGIYDMSASRLLRRNSNYNPNPKWQS